MPTVVQRGLPLVLSLDVVSALFGVDRHAVMRWVEAGRFPAPFQPGRRSKFWHRDDIEEALRNRDVIEAD
jgi:predicted DNA-binding transcriptional regulator AlpA